MKKKKFYEMIKISAVATSILAISLSATACTSTSAQASQTPQMPSQNTTSTINYGEIQDTHIRIEPIELTDQWDKVFPLSNEVNHRKVSGYCCLWSFWRCKGAKRGSLCARDGKKRIFSHCL